MLRAVLPLMRPRALVSALAICVLGCASGKPSGQSSNDGGKDAAAANDVATTGDAPGEMAVTGDAPADMAQASNDAASNDTAPQNDAAGTGDAPRDVTATGDAPADIRADVSSPTDTIARDVAPGEPLPPAPGKVYAHSGDTLYLLEPISKQVTMVGVFDCVGTTVNSMVDIAIDKTGKMTGSAAISFNNALGGALVSINPANARCEALSRGPDLLTSLTYVPEGTLLANEEALVGYAADRYVRVDPTTGGLTDIGLLNNAASGGTKWISSGDVVSIKNGGTYLTVKAETGGAGGRGDRIVEVDPKTGGLLRIIGATGMDDVLGLGYWGGIAYGFTLAGKLIEFDLTTGAGTVIPIPNAPSDLSFLGAGTTTIAPIIFE